MKTIIECGANNGSSTEHLLKMFDGDVMVYIIEPTHELVSKHLYPKFGQNPNVRICQFAVDVENTFKEFKVASLDKGAADWGCSSLHDFSDDIHEKWPNRPDFEFTHKYVVPTMTLYDFCRIYNITEIDYLWIDTQGNDFNVLLSLGDKINIVKSGKCEVAENVELYKNTNNKSEDVLKWLDEKGFETNIDRGYYESDINFTKKEKLNLSTLLYTNEMYFNLNYITVPHLKNSLNGIECDINIVSNKFPEHEKFDGLIYHESNVEIMGNGGQFRDTILYALENIKEDYIFLTLDDYIFVSPFKKDRFVNLIKILDELNGDFISLASHKHMDEYYIPHWEKPNIDLEKYGFPKDCLYIMDDRYKHMLSVQPCIWRKSTLIDIIKHNEKLSLHDLDTLNILNKKGERRSIQPGNLLHDDVIGFYDYGLKNYCFSHPYMTYNIDERPPHSDYLIINYLEVIRHGKWMGEHVLSGRMIRDILETKEYKSLKDKLTIFY